jgi:UDP-glucose 4-epimerase
MSALTKRSLVTGGAGFIGAHVTRELLRMGHDVIVLDDLSGGFEDNVPAQAEFVRGSVNDYELVQKVFADHSIDYVFHLAAYAAEGLSHFIKRFNYTNNVVGSVNLINQAVIHRVRCFVFTSSIAVYGQGQLPMTEDQVPIPEDPYGIAKYAVELDLRATHEIFGMNYVIFRPHNVYGEFQNIGDRYRNVVGIFMNQLMSGKPLTVFGDGAQTRAFSYIADVAPHIARAVDVPAACNQVFNIGGDISYSVRDLATEVMRAMGVEQPIRHLPARHEVVHAYADHTKAKQTFGIRDDQLTRLSDGVRRMADWAKRVGVRKSARFGELEITEKLPAIWLED